MDEIKLIIARNITDLRRKNNMTQAELAERLNYSDKAISKWERGESLPDVTVLKSVADVFRVTVDYLLRTAELSTPSVSSSIFMLVPRSNSRANPRTTVWKKESMVVT